MHAFYFIEYLWISIILIVSIYCNQQKIRRHIHLILTFFMLLVVNFFETLPKHKACFFILFYIAALTNEKLLLPLYWRLKQIFIRGLEKLIEYSISAVNVVSSNPCVGPITRIKISLFLLSIWIYELLSIFPFRDCVFKTGKCCNSFVNWFKY